MESSRFNFAENLNLLREKLLALLPNAGSFATPIDGFSLHRYNNTDVPGPHFYNPCLIIAVQGRKWVRIGLKDYSFGEHNCFIAGVNMPVSSCLLEAEENTPYLSVSLKLDNALIAGFAGKVVAPIEEHTPAEVGAAVQPLDPDLLDACLRIIELIDKPQEAKTIGSLIYQEIHFRLLATPFGNQLRQLNTPGSKNNHIHKVIVWLQENYKKPASVEMLAARANMAPSTFHKNFKAITTLSPLQYQKSLQLTEAHKLMLIDKYSATRAAFAVGYESSNQFSREYKKLFGDTPRKNIKNLTSI
ncbi:AraC family transcriptional regulator [Pseudomonas gingeri]|uniref:AraC family transcriptional regulator n=1 Tax=Pseudomonas gingeri TaxID=117681 RepID=UPI00159FB63C|nr:AraC family transcriptional regulator [Pseudomonas gingeri]NWD67241.1 AraC family transcriptional regulator [Pseudomonas gingeri]NWD77923.1 AraC family transcriptional regulator [Pseudomonas gingeri]